MDRTDLSIFREMWRERIVWMGGWDRSMSSARIARRLSLSTSTVSDRLRGWRKSGFIRGVKIFPNPELLGARYCSAHVFTTDPAAFEAVERMLPLLSNLAHALEIESGFWTVLLDDEVDSVARSLALLGTIPHTAIDRQIWPLNFPPCDRRPVRRDWEMLRVLARHPEARPARLASELQISTKTAARRLERLVADRLVFFHPIPDFSATPGVVVNLRLTLKADADVLGLWEALERIDPVIVPQGDWAGDRLVTLHTLPGKPAESYLAFYWHFDTPAQVWGRIRSIAKLPGVARVVPQFVTRVWRGPSCLEARIAAAAAAHTRRGS